MELDTIVNGMLRASPLDSNSTTTPADGITGAISSAAPAPDWLNYHWGTIGLVTAVSILILILIVGAVFLLKKVPWGWFGQLVGQGLLATAIAALIFFLADKIGDLEDPAVKVITGLAVLIFMAFVQILTLVDQHNDRVFSALKKNAADTADILAKYCDLGDDVKCLYSDTLRILNDLQGGMRDKLAHYHGFYAKRYRGQLAQICTQIAREEMFARRREFREVWADLMCLSDNYWSICDLSDYHDKPPIRSDEPSVKIYQKDKQTWEERIEREVKVLVKNRKSDQSFQKLIIYKAPTSHDGPTPLCVAEKRCAGKDCQTVCLVRDVASYWSANADRLRRVRSGAFGNERNNHFIWLVPKKETDDEFYPISEMPPGDDDPDDATKSDIASVDIGLFGSEFIGEEFKVPANTGRPRVEEFLYRVRRNPILVERAASKFRNLRDTLGIPVA